MSLPSPERVDLQRVSADERPQLEALIDVYLAELATHRERPAGPTDVASYVYFPLYWTEAGRHPFFITLGTERVGLVLVREVRERGVIELSEFYVQPAHQRGGVGRAAMDRVWDRFPGRWELQVHRLNRAATGFWPTCIEARAAGPVRCREVVEDDGRRLEYAFEIASR